MIEWKHLQLSSEDYENYIHNEDQQQVDLNDLNIGEWQQLYHTVQYLSKHPESGLSTTSTSKATSSSMKTIFSASQHKSISGRILRKPTTSIASSATNSRSEYQVLLSPSRDIQSNRPPASQKHLDYDRTRRIEAVHNRGGPHHSAILSQKPVPRTQKTIWGRLSEATSEPLQGMRLTHRTKKEQVPEEPDSGDRRAPEGNRPLVRQRQALSQGGDEPGREWVRGQETALSIRRGGGSSEQGEDDEVQQLSSPGHSLGLSAQNVGDIGVQEGQSPAKGHPGVRLCKPLLRCDRIDEETV